MEAEVVPLSQWFGYLRVLDTPEPKSLVFWELRTPVVWILQAHLSTQVHPVLCVASDTTSSYRSAQKPTKEVDCGTAVADHCGHCLDSHCRIVTPSKEHKDMKTREHMTRTGFYQVLNDIFIRNVARFPAGCYRRVFHSITVQPTLDCAHSMPL